MSMYNIEHNRIFFYCVAKISLMYEEYDELYLKIDNFVFFCFYQASNELNDEIFYIKELLCIFTTHLFI